MRGLILGAVMLTAWGLGAQAQQPCGAPQAGLFAGITLSDTQQKQVDSLWAAHEPVREEMRASRQPGQGQGQDSAHVQLRAAMQEQMRQSYRAVLTPAQQVVFDSNLARMPQSGPGQGPYRRGGGNGPCGGARAAGPDGGGSAAGVRHRILIAVLVATACSSERPSFEGRPSASDSLALRRARAAADDLGRDLMGLLTSELQRGGPAAAIAVCADSAQRRTARHNSEGTAIRRVSTRTRNPANRPDTMEAAVLRSFATALAAGRVPGDTAFIVEVAGGAREVRFLRPIRVAEPCLACHGSAERFSPQVRELLSERYPQDEAVGYQVGDLRGAISVRVRDTHP